MSHRNDSSQVRDLLQYGNLWEKCEETKRESEREQNKKESSGGAGCPAPGPSSSPRHSGPSFEASGPSCGLSSSSFCSNPSSISSGPSGSSSPRPSSPTPSGTSSPGPSGSSSPGPSGSSSPGPSSPGPSSPGPSGTRAGGRRRERDVSSSSCQLDDLKRLQQCDIKLGLLEFSGRHTVLIDVDLFNTEQVLKAQRGGDVWQSKFVKLPWSQGSIVMSMATHYEPATKMRRWDLISSILTPLARKSSVTVDELKKVILQFNPKYRRQWSFDALSTFVKWDSKAEKHYCRLFPKIAALALKLPEYVMKAIPLLQREHPASITLSQVQISCLLANAFFCTFPHRNDTGPNAEYHNYPTINFSSLFGNWSQRKKEKLKAIMHYFRVVTNERPRGLVTFERRCLRDMDISYWRSCREKMPKLHVTSRGTIEDEGRGMLQVDFAASRIGGGVLSSGLVQEEILFLIHPELIVSRLFTERLEDNECLIITGPQQFSRYSGFSDNFKWMGHHDEDLQRDEWLRLERQILAIDALHFKSRREQYDMRSVSRELNKAYCGFKRHWSDEPDIATGKWGCGAFNGDPQLKAVIQLMAAARAKRGLAFFTFQDEELKEGLEQIYHLLVTEGTTVDKLYGLLEDFCAVQQEVGDYHVDLFGFIRNTITPSKSHL